MLLSWGLSWSHRALSSFHRGDLCSPLSQGSAWKQLRNALVSHRHRELLLKVQNKMCLKCVIYVLWGNQRAAFLSPGFWQHKLLSIIYQNWLDGKDTLWRTPGHRHCHYLRFWESILEGGSRYTKECTVILIHTICSYLTRSQRKFVSFR